MCGNVTLMFQDCEIETRKPDGGQTNILTVPSRDKGGPLDSNFSFQRFNRTASSDLVPIKKKTIKMILGRLWYALLKFIFTESFIDDFIDLAG